jgi:hypothetical protein
VFALKEPQRGYLLLDILRPLSPGATLTTDSPRYVIYEMVGKEGTGEPSVEASEQLNSHKLSE